MLIFNYSSAQQYLQDVFLNKKKKNSRYSVRAWAKAIGMKSHTPLVGILAKKKTVPISLHSPLSINLGLSETEKHYFMLLIQIENSADPYTRQMLTERMLILQKHQSFKMKDLDQFEILSDPFYGQLIEMTALKEFHNDPEWIHHKSRIKRTPEEVMKVIDTLIKHDLLTTDEEGRLIKKHAHLTNVADLANIGSQIYHRNVSQLAADQVQQQSVTEREYNGYAINIDTNQLEKMKTMIRTFIKDFIVQFEAPPGEGDATYQLNVQLFNLLKDD